MAKRYGKELGRDSFASKRAKIQEDVWGDDFDENAIEEMDFIASQACSQDPRQAIAGAPTIPPKSQTLASSEIMRPIPEDPTPEAFDDFESNLLRRVCHNSTFRPKNDIVLADDQSYARRLEKLEQENRKLLDDFMTKEGETVFLRSQLQQTQLRAENEKIEKARFIEEQSSRHRAELEALHKEKECLKTQNEFQSLQLGSLMERCKLLESGAVKLTQPRRTPAGESPNRTRALKSEGRAATKAARVIETAVQTEDDLVPRDEVLLKAACLIDRPLDRLPRSIFEPSLPEKSVVDIQIVEKIGRKNLPILQEEDTFRIFENPVLVRPIVTIVDGRQLNVEYFLPDLATLIKKTHGEINSQDSLPIVNKIVSTTRELFLNSTIVLRTIAAAMKNDDIRDMNDLYFSDFYNLRIEPERTICDSRVWYDEERGIEARRAVAVLSYLSETSDYLCDYIAGKTRLRIENDENYENYGRQMIRYGNWGNRDRDYEMLEMMLEFVTALGIVRRSHQFSGLLCAIARTLCTVQRRANFCDRGLKYVGSILREMVFSRPLLRCFIPITRMMETFCKLPNFGTNLCSSRPNVKVWNGVLHFTSDACPLEIYVAQLERFRLDPYATIELCDAFLSAIRHIVLAERIAWLTESANTCNCCSRMLSYAITLLCRASRVVTLDEDKINPAMKKMRLNGLKKGITFLSYLAKREPDFIMRVSDIEDSFHLFMQRVANLPELALHDNEQEALSLVKLSLSLERGAQNDGSSSKKSARIFSVRRAFADMPSADSGRWYEVDGSRDPRADGYKDLLGR